MADLRLAYEEPRTDRSPEYDEAEVVRRAQLGSAAAFEQLVERRGPDVYRYLAVRLRNESDARDALQETMAAAWSSLPTLRRADRFWPWLVTIAARKAIAAARGRVPQSDQEVDLLPGEEGSVLEIWDAIGGLPPNQRDVLILRYRLQLSERETARALGIRVSTVKSRAFLARKALLELLA